MSVMPSRRARGKGRLKRDFSDGARRHAAMIQREWADTQQKQQQQRSQMSGGLAAFMSARPAPTNPPPDPEEP